MVEEMLFMYVWKKLLQSAMLPEVDGEGNGVLITLEGAEKCLLWC